MFSHKCKLLNAYIPIEYQHVDSGICISCRRKAYTFCMINQNHPTTMRHYRSSTLRRQEQIRHLTNHPYIIHPFSMFTLYWDFIYLIACTTVFLFLSITVTDPTSEIIKRSILIKWLLDGIMFLDILKNFMTGYYNNETYDTVLKPKYLARHYLKTYFLIDFLLLAPTYLYFMRNYLHIDKITERIFRVSLHLEVLRIARLPRCCKTLKTGAQYFKFSNSATGAILIIYKYLMIIVWLYEVVYYSERFMVDFLVDKPRRLNPDNILHDFLAFTRLLLLISDGQDEANHPLEVLQAIVFIGISYGLTLFFYCQIFQEVHKYTIVRRQNEKFYREFSLFTQVKGLPIAITKKIMQLFRFKYQYNFYNETNIKEILSQNLTEEVQLHIAKEHIRNVEFLRNIPAHVLAQLVARIKKEVYLSNEVIVVPDVPGSCMYFIRYGTVAVFTPTGKEICHLKDGDHFGEIALLFQEYRTATIVAVTHCELFILKRSDFIEVINLYPKVRNRVYRMAHLRLIMSKKQEPIGKENSNVD